MKIYKYKKIEARLEKNVKNRRIVHFSIFIIITIPLFTYLFATKASPFDYTFSMIGNKLGYRLSFIIRGIFTGLMLTFYILRMFILNSFQNKKARKLLIRSSIFLILTVFIPAIESLPILKQLHMFVAIGFAISLTTSLYLFIKYLKKTKSGMYNRSMILFLITIFGSLINLFIFGKSGMFELFFFLALTLFLFIMQLFRNKNKDLK